MKITEFLEIYEELLQKMDRLSGHDEEMALELENITEGDPEALAGITEFIHSMTHEEATTLGWHAHELGRIMQFFSFKRRFPDVEESLFEQILDPEMVTQETKKELIGHGYDLRGALDLIQAMRRAWRDNFSERYSVVANHIQSRLRIR